MKTNETKKSKEKPKYNIWQNTGYMLGLAWRRKKAVLGIAAAVVLLAVATNLTELFVTPVILQKVEARAALPDLLGTIAVFAGMMIVLAALSGYVSANTVMSRLELRVQLTNQKVQKVCTTAYPHTEDAAFLQKSEKAQNAINSNSDAAEAGWETLTELAVNLIGFVLYLFLLTSLKPMLLVIVLVTSLTGYFVTKQVSEWAWRHREEEAEHSKRIHYVCRNGESSALAKDIRIFGMRPWIEEVYGGAKRLYEAVVQKREREILCGALAELLLSVARNGIAYFYLISMTLEQGLPASQFLLYFTAVGGFSNWVTGILAGFTELEKKSRDISALREFLETEEPFWLTEGEPLPKKEGGSYELELKDVSFRYPGAQRDALQEINLKIRPGEKLAVVGLNGAGKTTLVKLLCGFYDPTKGQVLLNGKDIRNYNRNDYYSLITAVFQQFSVLEVTLAENVAQTAEHPDMERVKNCIEKAGLTKKVESLPKQYETHIGRTIFEDGVELSGGETQRLMLARALYKNAPIMVLDEPTAALDPIAENEMYLKYYEMTQNCTSVYISHRLASTRFCDRIILLAEGRIAEEGSHEELMERNGQYAALFDVQKKYYAEEKGGQADENR